MPEDETFQSHTVTCVEPIGLALSYSPISTPLSAVAKLAMPALPDVPPVRASAGRASAIVSTLLTNDSDLDAEGESDVEQPTDDDDEYVPSRLPRLSQRRAYKNAYNSPSSSLSAGTSASHNASAMSPSTSRPSIAKKSPAFMATIAFDDEPFSHISRTAPRRAQVSAKASASFCPDRSSKRQWHCPHCSYVQTNHREPDLRRHISTHFRDLSKNKYVCCGVPLAEAKKYGVPENTEVMYFWGQPMVGGCAKEVSRKDALKRHLRNSETCVGDLSGAWHPFNRQ